MNYDEIILNVLCYIEVHIQQELSAREIAEVAGYSPYHFSRIFKNQMGCSVMEYVKERRLIRAAREIFEGKKVLDVAIAYGYETHSGFSKAFRKKFGFTPTEHMIYVISMLDYLTDDKGGALMMKEGKSIFARVSIDFKEVHDLHEELIRLLGLREGEVDYPLIEAAYELGRAAHEGQKRHSGEEYFTHCMWVAILLTDMGVDEKGIAGGLLHDIMLQHTTCTLEEITRQVSSEVANLVEGVTVLDKQKENLLTQIDAGMDPRVMVIKLADRLHNMRTIRYMDESRWKEKARETIESFTPLAARLKLCKIKRELEDLALQYL